MSLIGETKLELLRMLSEEPRHGYALHRELQLTSSTVYTHLDDLEAAGVVEQTTVVEGTRGRRPYRLTENGHQLLDALNG